MWLYYPDSEGNCAIDKVHTSFRKVVLNGADPLSYKDHAKQSLPFPFRVVSFVNRASMDVVDDNSGNC